MSVIQTNWIVCTGAPGAGKTAILRKIAEYGFTVRHEVSRELIERHLERGFPRDLLLSDRPAFQDLICKSHIEEGKRLARHQCILMDRAGADGLAYRRLLGIDDSWLRAALGTIRYRAVLYFERMPLGEDDGQRLEKDDDDAALLDTYLREAYASLGYAPIVIPVCGCVAERVSYVLDILRQVGA